MKSGIVVSWNEHRGFGFIAPSGGGKDIWFHALAVRSKAVGIRAGDEVSYETAQTEKGPKAVNVTVLRRKSPDHGLHLHD